MARGCPVDHGKGDGAASPHDGRHAMRSSPPPAAAAAAASVTTTTTASDPSAPLARTSTPLNTHRMQSTIAKTGTEGGTWEYPSDRMFYEALRRKGYAPRAEDMRSTVAIHNTVNEQAWIKVMEWEAMHACEECSLLRFKGKPTELSPKARLYNWLGYTLPFDRHDWTVDRCGTPVRYIIDFYTGAPHPGKPVSLFIDARPALDSAGAYFDRLRFPVVKFLGGIFGGR